MIENDLGWGTFALVFGLSLLVGGFVGHVIMRLLLWVRRRG